VKSEVVVPSQAQRGPDEPIATDLMVYATEEQKQNIATILNEFFTAAGDMKEGVNQTIQTALKKAAEDLKRAGPASIHHELARQGDRCQEVCGSHDFHV